jgi:DNA-directed RNA polymerase subunit H (RpoH/RPB5)
MANVYVNKNTPLKEINKKIELIEKTSLPSVYLKDVIQSKKQNKDSKVVAINRLILNGQYKQKP